MIFLQNLSIRNKLIGIILFVTLLSLGFGFTIVTLQNIKSFKGELVNRSILEANMIGEFCVTPLAFDDKLGAEKMLAKLKNIPSVTFSRLYDVDGNEFAKYGKEENSIGSSGLTDKEFSVEFEGDFLKVFQPIEYQDKYYGIIYLLISTELLNKQINSYLFYIISILFGVIIFAFIIADSLQKKISGPILNLATATDKISKTADYSIQIQKHSEDEIGNLYDSFNNMIKKIKIRQEERDKAEEALKKSETRLNKAQQIAHIGSWELDLITNTIHWSDEVYRIFNLEPQQFSATYEAFLDNIHPDDREFVNTAYTESAKNKKPYDIDHRLLLKNGTIKFVHESGETYYNNTGKAVRSLGMVQDITRRKLAEEELKKYQRHLEELVEERTSKLDKANIKLQELDIMKSIFIASMSHELRTPLNSIIGFTGLILQGISGKIDGEARDDMEIVYKSSKHLLSLINDVIDISKIEADRFEIHFEDLILDKVLKEAVTAVSKDADDKELKIKTSYPRGLRIVSDRKRLLQCVLNLISNAVKFTEKGTIELKAVKKAGVLEISVKDTGIGIKKEDLPRLFNSFIRLDSPMKEVTPGTGLGLYLTKKIMNSVFNGDIKLKSQYGKGSTFTLIIPLDKEV